MAKYKVTATHHTYKNGLRRINYGTNDKIINVEELKVFAFLIYTMGFVDYSDESDNYGDVLLSESVEYFLLTLSRIFANGTYDELYISEPTFKNMNFNMGLNIFENVHFNLVLLPQHTKSKYNFLQDNETYYLILSNGHVKYTN